MCVAMRDFCSRFIRVFIGNYTYLMMFRIFPFGMILSFSAVEIDLAPPKKKKKKPPFIVSIPFSSSASPSPSPPAIVMP